MKKLLFIFILLVIGFFAFQQYAKTLKNEECMTTRIASKLFDFNTFQLYVDANLDINDFQVINLNSGNTIFENGQSRSGIDNDYGRNSFAVYYQSIPILETGVFKYNNWYANDYKLYLRKSWAGIIAELKVFGPSSEEPVWYKVLNDTRYQIYEENGFAKEQISKLLLERSTDTVVMLSDGCYGCQSISSVSSAICIDNEEGYLFWKEGTSVKYVHINCSGSLVRQSDLPISFWEENSLDSISFAINGSKFFWSLIQSHYSYKTLGFFTLDTFSMQEMQDNFFDNRWCEFANYNQQQRSKQIVEKLDNWTQQLRQ